MKYNAKPHNKNKTIVLINSTDGSFMGRGRFYLPCNQLTHKAEKQIKEYFENGNYPCHTVCDVFMNGTMIGYMHLSASSRRSEGPKPHSIIRKFISPFVNPIKAKYYDRDTDTWYGPELDGYFPDCEIN